MLSADEGGVIKYENSLNACVDYVIAVTNSAAEENVSREFTKQPMMLCCAVSYSLRSHIRVEDPSSLLQNRSSSQHHHAVSDFSTDAHKSSFESKAPKLASSSGILLAPGELVSVMQSELLLKERFVAVLGAKEVDSWKFDWTKLEGPTFSLTDSYQLSVMTSVHLKLQNLAVEREDAEFKRLRKDFLHLESDILVVHIKRLKSIVTEYFNSLFPGSSMMFSSKDNGVQLGIKVKVTLLSGEERTYHVKTHSLGVLFSKIIFVKPVNSLELLVYKVLEHLGVGCETHFMQRSAEDVYIATLDAGHDGNFDVFERGIGCDVLGEAADEAYGQALWGVLQNINPDASLNDWDAIEANVQRDAVAQNFLIQISTLDMISRIFQLNDLLKNPGNFGFLETATAMAHVKVIDFRVAECNPLMVGSSYFGGFLMGCNLLYSDSSHQAIRYGLYDRPTPQRVKEALRVLTVGPLVRLHECLDSAYEEVRAYITSTEEFAKYADVATKKLDFHRDILHHNINFFTESLKAWKPKENFQAVS